MPSGGRIRRGEGVLIGSAGEFAAMSELLKRGVVAALTPTNTPWFDILATKGGGTVRVRVKTKTSDSDGWQWNARKDGVTIFDRMQAEGDFVVMVDLMPPSIGNRYFIVPTPAIDRWLKEDFERWKRQPGKRGKPHDPGNRRRILFWSDYSDGLAQHVDWGILWRPRKSAT